MSAPVTWFEIGTPDPDGARQFYGELFGWSYEADQSDPGLDYTLVKAGAAQPSGGIAPTGDDLESYAVFCVQVADVAGTCQRAEELGGKVLVPATAAPNGLAYAHLLDRDGNHIGVFSPPPSGSAS